LTRLTRDYKFNADTLAKVLGVKGIIIGAEYTGPHVFIKTLEIEE
jgi:hypothetical protein